MITFPSLDEEQTVRKLFSTFIPDGMEFEYDVRRVLPIHSPFKPRRYILELKRGNLTINREVLPEKEFLDVEHAIRYFRSIVLDMVLTFIDQYSLEAEKELLASGILL
jgi:hypothetical protein